MSCQRSLANKSSVYVAFWTETPMLSLTRYEGVSPARRILLHSGYRQSYPGFPCFPLD